MTSNRTKLWLILAEGLLLICVILAVPLVVYLDTLVLGATIAENSITEYLHNGLLLVSIVAFGVGVVKQPLLRGYLLMVATLFSLLFIREFDAVLDRIWHGFWLYPAVAALIAGAILVALNRATLVVPLLQHYQTRSATFIYIGMLLLAVFTRTFGTGSLWEPIMGDDYQSTYKTIIQEGLELMSYTLIAYGSVASSIAGFGARNNEPHSAQ